MFRTALLSTVASLALTGGAVVATAPVASAAPGGGCPYPANIVTTTSLHVNPNTVQYGGHPRARVQVHASGTGRTPKGTALVMIAGRSISKNLAGGAATIALPSRLAAGHNYNVRAKYVPKNCSRFQRSSSPSKSLRVVKAHSRAQVDVRNISRGEHPRARVSVTTRTGVGTPGRAKVRIKQGAVQYTKSVNLTRGSGSVRFPKLNRLGQWNVKVTYRGTRNVASDTGTDTFRVKRN